MYVLWIVYAGWNILTLILKQLSVYSLKYIIYRNKYQYNWHLLIILGTNT